MPRPPVEFEEQRVNPEDTHGIARSLRETSLYPIHRAYRNVKPKTAAYTMDPILDRVIQASGTFTITLPPAADADHVEYTVTNVGAGTVTVATAGGNIDGASTVAITTQYKSVTVASDGTNYFRTDSNF